MPYGTLNAGAITPGSGNTLTISETIALGTVASGVIGASVTGGAGLSGSTSLGTVTAGNLSNTAIIYPAGHVVQTVTNTTTSATAGASTAAGGGAGAFVTSTGMSVVITPKYSNSKIILSFFTGGMAYQLLEDIRLKVTGTTTGTVTYHNRFGHKANVSDLWVPMPWSVVTMDTPGTTATQTYQMLTATSVAVADADWLRVNPDGGLGTNPATIIAQEIKV
jgi:hypothetical protein